MKINAIIDRNRFVDGDGNNDAFQKVSFPFKRCQSLAIWWINSQLIYSNAIRHLSFPIQEVMCYRWGFGRVPLQKRPNIDTFFLFSLPLFSSLNFTKEVKSKETRGSQSRYDLIKAEEKNEGRAKRRGNSERVQDDKS